MLSCALPMQLVSISHFLSMWLPIQTVACCLLLNLFHTVDLSYKRLIMVWRTPPDPASSMPIATCITVHCSIHSADRSL